LEALQVGQIFEQYQGEDYNYVVAIVNISALLQQRNYILKNELFITEVGNEICFVKEDNREHRLVAGTAN
jgi:hypothetical protein